jgi:hypothetical protein
MQTFRVVQVKVPEHGIVWNIGLGVSLVAPIHGGEFDRISDKENWQVIADEILDSFFRVKLGSPAPHVSDSIAGTFFTTHSGNPGSQLCFLPNTGKPLGISEV